MTKETQGVGYDKKIAEAIRKIALRNIIDPKTGATYSDREWRGYVVAVHGDDDPIDYLRGTIDVKEYSTNEQEGEELVHGGVHISAIQNNTNGLVIVPKIGSDVIVTSNPTEQIEYVVMFSHADFVRIDSHEEVVIGVHEREPFDMDDKNSPDVHELELTGNHAITTYTKDSITTEIAGKSTTTQTIDDEKFKVEHEDSSVTVDKDKVELESGNSKVKVKDGTVFLGSDTGVSMAVLGEELADLLINFLEMLAQAQTNTTMGPQPLFNQIPNFLKMMQEIQGYKASCTGFLTNKVKVQRNG